MSSISSAGSSTVNPGTAAPLSITGLASGIDTNAIIQQLVALQQKQVAGLQSQQTAISNQAAAFQSIEGNLLDLQGQASALSQSINGTFDARTVTSSDPALVTAAASAGATPGIYSFRVAGLASAAEVASQGLASAASTISQGTFTVQVGSGPATSVTIDGTNNTLQGLANAINNAGAGVTAAVVNDGSGSQAFRLLLTANATGAANAIRVTNNLAASSGSATRPEFGSTFIGDAVAAAGNTSTATASSNAGAGGFTGAGNDTFTFTVVNGGTVGTDNGITLRFTDSSGANSGTITLNAGDAGASKAVAQGVQVGFGAGTLVAGDTFSVKAFTPTVQQAADASVVIGSGAGALTVSSPTNQLNDVIPGVTLNLAGANPNENVAVTVAANTSGIVNAVQNFVKSYNTAVTAINTATSFDPSTNTAGLLLGNGAIGAVRNQLARAVDGTAAGASLSSVGITTNADGTLSLNAAKLNGALSGQVPGVSLNSVKSLFALGGRSTSPGVQFVAGTDKTQAAAEQVVITQAATQGSVTGTVVLAGPVTINNSNNTITISVNGGTPRTISIPPGTYTPLQLSEVIQTQIASNSALAGGQVQVVLGGSQLSIVAPTYGAGSSVAVTGGTALPTLGFTAGQTGAGQDVAGHFVVNGVSEAATGHGQVLTGNSGNAATDGLAVQVSLTPAQVAANPQVGLTVTRGAASALGQTLNSLLDPVNGRLQTINQGFQTQVQNIQNTIARENSLIAQKEAALTAQFAALEGVISQLKNEGTAISTLTQSLSSATAGLGSAKSSSAPS